MWTLLLHFRFPSFLAQALQRKSLGRLSMLYVSDEGNFKNLYFASGSLHLQMGCIELDTPEHGFSYPTMVSSTPKPENTSAQLAPKKQITIPISWVYWPFVCDEPFDWGIFQRWGQQRCTGPRYSVRICSHTATKAPFLSQLLKPGRRKHLHLRYGFWFRRLGAIKDRATGWRCFNLCEFGVVAAQPTWATSNITQNFKRWRWNLWGAIDIFFNLTKVQIQALKW